MQHCKGLGHIVIAQLKTCARTLCVQQNLNNKIKFQPCCAFSSEKRMNQGKTKC